MRLSTLEFSRGYDVSGPASGPTIVFLHDSVGSRMVHQALIPALGNLPTLPNLYLEALRYAWRGVFCNAALLAGMAH
jgi:hypothetical protein